MVPPSGVEGGPAAMVAQTTPKTMSSRLMTMKFMQRGAAAAAVAEAASSPATPKTDNEGSSAKRRKFAHKSSAPATPATPLYDQTALKAAIEEEEKKRRAAVEKRAAELGDSHWVMPGISTKPKKGSRMPLKVVQVGFAQIDYAGPLGDDDSDDALEAGDYPVKARLQFNMKKAKPQKVKQGDDSGSDDSNPDSDSASEDGDEAAQSREGPNRGRQRNNSDAATKKRTRSSLSTRRDDERKRAQELAGKRRMKEVKLNKLTSISSASAQSVPNKSPASFTCHSCGKPGHKAAACPAKRH